MIPVCEQMVVFMCELHDVLLNSNACVTCHTTEFQLNFKNSYFVSVMAVA